MLFAMGGETPRHSWTSPNGAESFYLLNYMQAAFITPPSDMFGHFLCIKIIYTVDLNSLFIITAWAPSGPCLEGLLRIRVQLDSSGVHLVKDKQDEQIRLIQSFVFPLLGFPARALGQMYYD